jgi:hypothetical protein
MKFLNDDNFNLWKDKAPPQRLYRTAMEGAVSLDELLDVLDDNCTGVSTIRDRLEHFGIYDESYEYKISQLRELLEQAYAYMTLNTFRQQVPKETLREFKSVMAQVSALVRANKEVRADD